MISPFFQGVGYVLKGFSLLSNKSLRPFILIPVAFNIIIFSAMSYIGIHYFGQLLHWLDSLLPSWLHWLDWLFWSIFIVINFVITIYTFTLVANTIASPFNGLLSEKVFIYCGKTASTTISNESFIATIPKSIKRQWRMILYFLPRFFLFLLLFIIPVVQVVAEFIWFIFSAWMMVIQYSDYAYDCSEIEFDKMRMNLRTQSSLHFGFGATILILTMIPLVNFFVMPAAVIGATVLYCEQQMR